MQLFFKSLIFALMGSASWIKDKSGQFIGCQENEISFTIFGLTLEQGMFSGKVLQKTRMSAASGDQSF